jgi:hypothetical protein
LTSTQSELGLELEKAKATIANKVAFNDTGKLITITARNVFHSSTFRHLQKMMH